MDVGATELLTTPPFPVSLDQAADLARALYGFTGNITSLGGERDRNFRVEGRQGSIALKVANPAEPESVVEMQQRALRHVTVTDPDLPVPRVVETIDGDDVVTVEMDGATAVVRAVSFLEGDPLGVDPSTPELRRAIGELLARLDIALDGFSHPTLERRFLWDLNQVSTLRPFTEYLEAAQAHFVLDWLDHFDAEIAPRLNDLRCQAIHADFNGANLIVDPTERSNLNGVIDFGDLVRAPLVMDPAIGAAYQSLRNDRPVEAMAQLVGSFHATLPLTDAEIDLIPDLVVGRLVQSITIAAWRADLHEDNRDYILLDAVPAWTMLQRLSAETTRSIGESLRRACA